MRQKTGLLSAAFLCLIATLFSVRPALSAPPAPSAKPAQETMAQAVTQADGITTRVVDKLWETTDTYWHVGDYNRIVGLLRVCVEADPSFIDAYSSGAWLLWSMGDLPAADAFVEYGVSRTNEKAAINYAVAQHLYVTKRYAQAIPYLKQVIEDKQATAIMWGMLGHCYRLNKQLPESVQTWRRVVQKFPDFAPAKANLARVEKLLAEQKS